MLDVSGLSMRRPGEASEVYLLRRHLGFVFRALRAAARVRALPRSASERGGREREGRLCRSVLMAVE
jgi:hypothetical protein